MPENILFVPAQQPGMGTGHIVRCTRLAHALRAQGCRVYFLQDDASAAENQKNLLKDFECIGKTCAIWPEIELVVIDKRSTGLQELHQMPPYALVVGLDEGGKARTYLPVLIDSLPAPRSFTPPNYLLPYMGTDVPRLKPLVFPFQKILISFGGEDQAGLSGKLLRLLLHKKIFTAAQITVVEGPCFRPQHWPPGVTVLHTPTDLPSLIPEYDVLFTHFGLSCYDALKSGVPVILFNPSRYHRRLAQNSGFPEIGVCFPSARLLMHLLKSRAIFQMLLSRASEYDKTHTPDIAALLGRLAGDGNTTCPVCAARFNKVVARFENRTYFRCSRCRLIYLLKADNRQTPLYDHAYFFNAYKQQYGRTYLEDFENIKNLSKDRVSIIEKIIRPLTGKTLLDIGCAYGPFLAAFAEAGGMPMGIDIAPEAVAFIKQELHLEAYAADFEHQSLQEMKNLAPAFDIISMWYVIEHFRQLAAVLHKVRALLKPGGLFAFATPSSSGISARKNLKAFLNHSPADHYTIFDPRHIRGILRIFGFQVRCIRITGHHPERFPGILAWKWTAGLSRIGKLGDTFEVYAGKV